MNEPTTEAGKRLLAGEYGPHSTLLALVPAIEAEAREQGFAQGFGEALNDTHGAVAEARADLAKRIEERVRAMDGFWHPFDEDDAQTDKTRRALIGRGEVLAIVREEAERGTHPFVRGSGCMSRCGSCGRTFSDPVHGPQPENIRKLRAEAGR